MKTMKKYFKVILCFLAFAACSFLLAFSPTVSAVYAEAEQAFTAAVNEIKTIKMQTKVNPNSKNPEEKKFLIPFPASNGADTIIRVIDPAGASHDYTVGTDDEDVNDYKFFADKASTDQLPAEQQVPQGFVQVLALNNGTYKVVFKTTASEKEYYSNTYNVVVENVSYELDFTGANNLTNLYRTEVAEGSKVEVFSALAKIVGDEDATSETVSPDPYVTVTKNGAIQKLGSSDFVIGTGEEAGKYFINASEAGDVYTIEYTYTNSVNRPTKTFTFKVVAASDYSAEKTLTVSTPTLPSMQLGQESVTLPKLTVNRGEEKNVEHNVTEIVVEKESDSNIKYTLPANTYKFDFTKANFGADNYEDMVGIYIVKYTVKDAYGNTKTYTTRTSNAITVSSKPTVSLAYDYTVTLVDGVTKVAQNGVNGFTAADVDTNHADTTLKASYGYSEIILPAIYGEDSVTATEDLMFVRSLRNSKTRTTYYVDNLKYENGKLVAVEYGEKGYNYAYQTNADDETTHVGNPNQSARFQFSAEGDDQEMAGTYYLQYQVISKTVKERTGNLYVSGTTEYSIEVLQDTVRIVKDSQDDLNQKAPTVEITNLKNSSIRPEDSVTVKVTSSDSADYDARIRNAVFYYTSVDTSKGATGNVQTDIETAYNNLLSEANANILDTTLAAEMVRIGYANFTKVNESETANSFVVESFKTLTADDVTVVAVALNDNTNQKIGVDSVTLTLKKTSESNPPAALVQDGTDTISGETFGQAEEVSLPTVKFDDAEDSNLQLSVMYYIGSPETDAGLDYLYPSNVEYVGNTIKGGTITTSATGTYYVVYTAIDDAGNTSVAYFTFEVEDTSKPILSVNVVSDNEITQTGNTVTAEIGSTINFETVVRSGDGNNTDYTNTANVTVKVQGNGLSYSPSGDADYSYIFNSVGTYTVTIGATVTGKPDADSKVIYVNVTKPNLVWLEEFDIPQYAAKNSEVYIPDVAASHNAVVTVKVTAPGGATPVAGEAKKTVNGGYSVWMFKTNENSKGTYTVTYTAVSKYATITKTFSIKVGDNVAPVFKMNYENELKQDIVYTGSDISYTVEMNKSDKKFVVSAKRGDETIYSYDLGLVISDKDDSGYNNQNMTWSNLSYEVTGEKVTGESGTYTITGTGKVTLKLMVEDSYNNKTTKELTFNVVAESDVKEVNDTVVGTILIVLSLVVLAGVILFFIFTGNGKGGNKKAKNIKEVKSTKTEEVKEEVKTEEVEAEKEEETVEGAETTEVVEETEGSSEEAKTGEVE